MHRREWFLQYVQYSGELKMIKLNIDVEIEEKNELIANNCIGGFFADGIEEGYIKSVSYEKVKQ